MQEITQGAIPGPTPLTDEPPGGAAGRLDLRSALTLALLILLIAMDAVAERLLNQQSPPFLLAGTRFAAAGLLALGLARALGLPFPRGRTLAIAIVFGLLQFGLGLALGYWGVRMVPAGLASLILALVPLFTPLTAAAARQERLTLRGLLGAVVALAGIGLLFGAGPAQVPPLRVLAVASMALSVGLVGVLLRAHPEVPGASINTVGLLVGAAILLAISVLTGETSQGLAALLPRMHLAGGRSRTW